MTPLTTDTMLEPGTIAPTNGAYPAIDDTVDNTVDDFIDDFVDDHDPYCYGWRYVAVSHADGTETLEQVPLTGYDVVFPQEGDILPVRSDHETAGVHSYDVLYLQAANDPTALVLKEVRIDFEDPNLEAVTPDIALIKGVMDIDGIWRTFYVLQEGATVEMVVEITSPSTRHLDVEEGMLNKTELARLRRDQRKNPKTRSKYYIYEQVGVRIYVVIDNARRRRGKPPPIIVYILTPDGYERLRADENGRVWLEILRISIGPSGSNIAWFDEHNQKIGDYRDLALAIQVADQHIAEAQAEAALAKERAIKAESEAHAARQELEHAKDTIARAESEAHAARQELEHAKDTIAKAESEAHAARQELEHATQKALQQGVKQQARETAKRLLGVLDEAAICAATGLSVEEIRTLSQDSDGSV